MFAVVPFLHINQSIIIYPSTSHWYNLLHLCTSPLSQIPIDHLHHYSNVTISTAFNPSLNRPVRLHKDLLGLFHFSLYAHPSCLADLYIAYFFWLIVLFPLTHLFVHSTLTVHRIPSSPLDFTSPATTHTWWLRSGWWKLWFTLTNVKTWLVYFAQRYHFIQYTPGSQSKIAWVLLYTSSMILVIWSTPYIGEISC